MAIMVPSGFFQNRTDHHALTHRLAMSALMRNDATSGQLGSNDGVQFRPSSLKVLAQSSPNMSVRLSRGLGIVRGLEANTQGVYVLANDAEITPITIGASHATLQRVDLVYGYVNDAVYSTALNKLDTGIVVGTNATVGSAVPNLGGLPSNAIQLGHVYVDPGVTSITQAKILDPRSFYCMQGGVRNIRLFQQADAGIDYGDLRYWNGRAEGWNAEATTGWRPLGVDIVQSGTGGFTYGAQSATVTVNTINIPDPGFPYYIEGEWSGLAFANATSTIWNLTTRLDTTAGTILSYGIAGNTESHRIASNWTRSAVLTGAHSLLLRFEKQFGSNGTFASDGAYYFRVVPQPPAANAGVLINV